MHGLGGTAISETLQITADELDQRARAGETP
jgi:hypothetical protein